MLSSIKHQINQVYLNHFCTYLFTDEYGNRIYLATTSHSDFTKRLALSPDRSYCTISYYAEGDCFYNLSLNLSLSLLSYV